MSHRWFVKVGTVGKKLGLIYFVSVPSASISLLLQVPSPAPEANGKSQPRQTATRSSPAPAVQVDVHRSSCATAATAADDNPKFRETVTAGRRDVKMNESAAANQDQFNFANDDDNEKENEEVVVEEEEEEADGGGGKVSFEMKGAGRKQPSRKSSSLKRSESVGGGVRPKEKLHGARLLLTPIS